VRIAFERTGLELDAAGSARAALDLEGALAARDDVEPVPLAQPRRRGGLVTGRVARGLERELGWFPFRLPARAEALGADLLHCPMPLAPPRRAGPPVVVAIGDALLWDHPEWFTRAHVLHARTVLARALRLAAAVVVPSAHTRDRLRARVPGLGEIHVTPWGVSPRFAPGPSAAASPYLLAVGTLQPRKNLEAALSAFERLHADGLEHRLVVVGARGWHDAALLARLRDSPAAAQIELAGRVDDDALVDLYRGADCLVFPSRAEGFGFPPLEAMACGTPVVASTAGSLPEVLDDAAPLVAPDDVAGLAAAVARVLADPEPWRERGRACAARYTWARCAAETVAVYRRVTRP
jgi:glycosyltransferase involved in cell wall biosynthesis